MKGGNTCERSQRRQTPGREGLEKRKQRARMQEVRSRHGRQAGDARGCKTIAGSSVTGQRERIWRVLRFQMSRVMLEQSQDGINRDHVTFARDQNSQRVSVRPAIGAPFDQGVVNVLSLQ